MRTLQEPSRELGQRPPSECVCSAKRVPAGSASAVTSLQRHEPSSLIGGMRALELAENHLWVRKAWIRDWDGLGSCGQLCCVPVGEQSCFFTVSTLSVEPPCCLSSRTVLVTPLCPKWYFCGPGVCQVECKGDQGALKRCRLDFDQNHSSHESNLQMNHTRQWVGQSPEKAENFCTCTVTSESIQ